MKTFKAYSNPCLSALVIALCLTGSSCTQKAPMAERERVRFVVGLSPFFDAAHKDAVYRHIVAMVLEDMPLNSSLWIYDAYHLQTVTQIDIPNVRAFISGKTRANQFKEEIHELKQFLASDHEKPTALDMDLTEAVRFPQFLDFVSDNLTGADHSVVVVTLGSPLYMDEKEPGFSMVNGYFPSDGHLVATDEESVYGLQGKDGALENVIVHLGYSGDPWVSAIHQEKIERFWSLFLKQQNSQLATFCGDLPTIFNAIGSRIGASEMRSTRYEIDPDQTKIEMLRISRDVGVADWITSDVPINVQQRPPSTHVGRMKIGIRWKGDIDIDLYARATKGSDMLFFQHTNSDEGFYFKDHRSSPEREYEFIEFEVPVDVWEAEALINFYEGNSPGGPQGEIRIEFEGRIYVGNFSIRGDKGNRGRSGRSQRDHWTWIDIPRILKLRSEY